MSLQNEGMRISDSIQEDPDVGAQEITTLAPTSALTHTPAPIVLPPPVQAPVRPRNNIVSAVTPVATPVAEAWEAPAQQQLTADLVRCTGGGAPIRWKAIDGAEGAISAQAVFPAKQLVFSNLRLGEMGLSLVPCPSRCGRGADAAACGCLEAVRIGASARKPRDSSLADGSIMCGLCRSDVMDFCIRCYKEPDLSTEDAGPTLQPNSCNDGCDRAKCDVAVSSSCNCGPFHAHCLEHWFAQQKALVCPACLKPWREALAPEDAKMDWVDVFLTGKLKQANAQRLCWHSSSSSSKQGRSQRVNVHNDKVRVNVRELSDQTPPGLKAFVAEVIGAAPAELDNFMLRQLGDTPLGGLQLDMDAPLQLRGNDKFVMCSMLAACSRYPLRATVELPQAQGKTVHLDLSSHDTIAMVCQEVQRREGFMAARLNLYGQRHLSSGASSSCCVKLARSVHLCEVVSHQMAGADPESKAFLQNVVLKGEILESEPKLVDVDFFGWHGRRLPSADPDAFVHQIWPSICPADPLQEINCAPFVYVSIRSTFGQSDEEGAEIERVGAQQLFTVTEAWSPWQQAQSDEGMRRLLAILHVVASHCKGDDASKLASAMRRLVPEFPPAADALRVVLGKRTAQVSRAEQAAVSTGILVAIKRLMGSFIPEDPRRLFEVGVRPFFYWLLHEGFKESAPGSFQWVQIPISKIPDSDEVVAAYSLEKSSELLVRDAAPNTSCDLAVPSRMPWNQLLKLLKTGDGFDGENKRWSTLLRVLSPLALGRAPRPSLTRDENGHMCVFTGMGKDVSRNTQIFLPLRGEEICTDVHHVAQKLRQLGDLGDTEASAEDSRTPQEAIMVLLDTSNSMNGSSGFQRTNGDQELDRLERLRQEGWDDTELDDDSEVKRLMIIEAFRNHPNLPDLRNMSRNCSTFYSRNEFAIAAHMEGLAMGVLQELCRLERVKSDSDPDVCRIYTKYKDTFVKILLDDPASRVNLSGKWCIEFQQAGNTEVRKKRKKLKKATKADEVKLALPVGKHEFCLNQSDNQLTGGDEDLSIEGEVDSRSATFRVKRRGKPIAECEAEISEDGLQFQAGTWSSGSCVGSFVGSRVDTQPSLETKPPEEFLCPITQEIMEDPVTCADGHSYSREALEHWACTLGRNTSPLTGVSFPRLASSIVQNHALRKQIEAWRLEHPSAGSGSKSSTSRLQRSQPFQIFVKTITGKTIVLDVDDETLFIEVKKKIMETTGIGCEAQTLVFEGKTRQDRKTLKECGVVKNCTLHLAMNMSGFSAVPISGSSTYRPILVTIKDQRSHEKMSLIAKPGDTVEGIMLRCWCAKPEELMMKPSEVTLWTGIKEVGDNYFTGTPLSKLDTKLGRFPLQKVRNSSGSSFFAGELEMAMSKRWIPMHQRRDLCRLECVKQLFHAFVNRSQAYDYPNEMGLAVFGDSVEVVCEISPVLEDFREKVDDVESDGDTRLYDALDEAASKLEEWKRSKHLSLPPDVSLRMLVLSDGKDTQSGCSAWEVARRLQRANITVDAITIGGERDKNLHAIAKATGGYVFQPKTLANALRLNELEVLLSSTERPPKTKPREVTSRYALSSYESLPVDRCDGDSVPARRRMPLLSLRASPLADAVTPATRDEASTHSQETQSRADVAGSGLVNLLAYVDAILKGCSPDLFSEERISKLERKLQSSVMPAVVRSIERLSADSPADVKRKLEETLSDSLVLPAFRADLKAFKQAITSISKFLNTKLKDLSSSIDDSADLAKLQGHIARLQKKAAYSTTASFAPSHTARSLPSVAAPGPNDAARQRRAMVELRHFLRAPHPSVEVFPTDNIFFWKMLLEGPEGTPYAGGLWVLYCLLPPEYPDCPPEIRFVTPIRHCNVNVYGRVCHSILDRNYTCDTTVLTIMHCIYGLLLNPDYDDPLDSTLALEFYEASGLYENSIMAHVARHAGGRDREDLRRRLMEGDDTCHDFVPLARRPAETTGEASEEAFPADLRNVWEELRTTFGLLQPLTEDTDDEEEQDGLENLDSLSDDDEEDEEEEESSSEVDESEGDGSESAQESLGSEEDQSDDSLYA